MANTAQMRSEVKTSLQILTNSSLVTVPIRSSFIATKNQSIEHQGKGKTFNGHRPVEGEGVGGVSELHQIEGGIGKSIPIAQEIS